MLDALQDISSGFPSLPLTVQIHCSYALGGDVRGCVEGVCSCRSLAGLSCPMGAAMRLFIHFFGAAILALLVVAPTAGDRSMAENFSIRPVGKVDKSSGRTCIVILPQFHDALLGMDGFSHLMVMYWFDRNDTPEKRATLRVHPRADKNNPLTGVFATRSPRRPNLIGVAVCQIESVEKDRIVVHAIDAFDQTPVIDIKPYIPVSDCVPDATVPWWVGGKDDP